MRTRTLAMLLSLLSVAGAAHAQTITLGISTGEGLQRAFDVVVREAFDVVTLVNTGGYDISALEWYQTELTEQVPGVFRLGTTRPNNTGDCRRCELYPGEHREVLGGCYTASDEFEVLRVTYGDFVGYVGDDVVLALRGLLPDDNQASSFDGSAGFVDCASTKIPFEVSGGEAWQTGSGVIVPSGWVVLNPTSPVGVGSKFVPLSRLKALFR